MQQYQDGCVPQGTTQMENEGPWQWYVCKEDGCVVMARELVSRTKIRGKEYLGGDFWLDDGQSQYPMKREDFLSAHRHQEDTKHATQ